MQACQPRSVALVLGTHMKAPKFTLGVGLLTALLVATASAQSKITYTFADPNDAALADIVKTGYKAIDEVGSKLVSETNKELASKETHLAVSVLHLKNAQLPKADAGMPAITAVKRTSLHIRNPLNAPDAADRAALMKISDQMTEEGTIAKVIVQKVEQEGKPAEWRVYRPIAVSKSCLACHGDPTKFAPGVKKALDEQYPMDQATDYSAQSWRGVLRVSLEAK